MDREEGRRRVVIRITVSSATEIMARMIDPSGNSDPISGVAHGVRREFHRNRRPRATCRRRHQPPAHSAAPSRRRRPACRQPHRSLARPPRRRPRDPGGAWPVRAGSGGPRTSRIIGEAALRPAAIARPTGPGSRTGRSSPVRKAHADTARPNSATPVFSQFWAERLRLEIPPADDASGGQRSAPRRDPPYRNQPPACPPPSQRGRRVPRFVIECITPNCHVDIASDGELVTTATVHPLDSILLSSAASPHHTTEGAWAP